MDRSMRRGLVGLGFALVGIGIGAAQTPRGVSGSGEVTNGSGERLRARVVRAITARSNGQVSGELEIHQYLRDPRTGGAVHFVTRERVTCLAIYGSRAWVGAIVTTSTNPALVRGVTEAIWYFEDNGSDAQLPDRISSFHDNARGTAALCDDPETQVTLLETAAPLARGDFEVRD